MSVDITGPKKSWLLWSHQSAAEMLDLLANANNQMGQYQLYGLANTFVDSVPANPGDPTTSPPVPATLASPGDFGFYPDANAGVDATDVTAFASLVSTLMGLFTGANAGNLALVQKFAAKVSQ